jgi:hypothetical protein
MSTNSKHFFPGDQTDSKENADAHTTPDSDLINSEAFQFDPSTRHPLTCAWSKLIKSVAISALIYKTDTASPEEIWYKLNSIAYKLYQLNFEFYQLTPQEL